MLLKYPLIKESKGKSLFYIFIYQYIYMYISLYITMVVLDQLKIIAIAQNPASTVVQKLVWLCASVINHKPQTATYIIIHQIELEFVCLGQAAVEA